MANIPFRWIDGDIIFKDGDVVWKDWTFVAPTGVTMDVTTPGATIGVVVPEMIQDQTAPAVTLGGRVPGITIDVTVPKVEGAVK